VDEVTTVDAAAGALVTAYLAAWSERRSAARRRLLEDCWDQAGEYSSWTTHVQGLDGMDAHIAAGQRHQPRRARRVRTCEVHVSGDNVSFTWQLVDEHGDVIVEGSEFAQIGEGGRFVRVTSFAGRPAELG
jgi:hypothetical protein